MFLCPFRTVTASGTLIEKMRWYYLHKLKRNSLYGNKINPIAACKICFVLRAKSVTQCPRVSYRDRDVLYGELNYYSGCSPPEFYL